MSKLVENALNRIQRNWWKPWHWFTQSKPKPPTKPKPQPKVKR